MMNEEQKLHFTIETQIEKATDELLCELLDEGYKGWVDIQIDISTKKGQVIVEAKSHKVSTLGQPHAKNSMRFHVASQGVKLISSNIRTTS
jgi:hypothetical protein